MERLFVAGIWIGACVSLMEAYPALALAQKRTIAVTQCLYSGPIGAMAGGAVGDRSGSISTETTADCCSFTRCRRITT
jgi:hypothetical protein